ncbi:MAG: LysR substrate-binding domain-containing protein [Pseudomonadota bacterium]
MPFRRLPALGSLRAFEAAARLSSFKAAAGELSVTPGAISQQVRALEDDLGVKLFARAVRSVSLTAQGRQLQPALTTAFLTIREAVDQVRPQSLEPLRVDSSGPIIRKWLLPRLHRFSVRNPDLGVTIQSLSHLTTFSKDGPDITIRFTRTPGAGLFARKLCEEYLLPLASPGLIERLDLRTPDDLVRAPLLHDTSPEIFKDAPDWSTWFKHAGLDPAGARRGTRFDRHAGDHAIEAAINGAGVVLGRHFLARSDMLDGRLISPFGPILQMHVSYFVVCQAGDETRPNVAAFMSWILEEAAVMSDRSLLKGSVA